MTDDSLKFNVHDNLTLEGLVSKFLPENNDYESYLDIVDESVKHKLTWLGLKSNNKIKITGEVTPADCIQLVIEDKWKLKSTDKDLVLMQHLIEYVLEGKRTKLVSTLAVEGKNQNETAMAKTVGLPLAIATLLLFQNKIEAKGVIIPTIEEIYNPILKELHNNGIIFREYLYS